MADFLPVLQRHAERKMPEITDRLQEIAQRLIPFFKWERKADLTLAHGDFHPGNILMGQGMIRVVIDWEFAGSSAMSVLKWGRRSSLPSTSIYRGRFTTSRRLNRSRGL